LDYTALKRGLGIPPCNSENRDRDYGFWFNI
jgi:hypothetical protein